ncbi:hypothetical protein DFJ73DRAFT_811326 [Zopfochytrium polystomum]|nr:hypothetical protein DFJ73DRAFT_811326 [Zopfochytrium polystomum]
MARSTASAAQQPCPKAAGMDSINVHSDTSSSNSKSNLYSSFDNNSNHNNHHSNRSLQRRPPPQAHSGTVSNLGAVIIAVVSLTTGLLIQSAVPRIDLSAVSSSLFPLVSPFLAVLPTHWPGQCPTVPAGATATDNSTSAIDLSAATQASSHSASSSSSSNPTVQAYEAAKGYRTSFGHSEFRRYLAIDVIHTTEIEPSIAPLVLAHDVYKDDIYAADNVGYDRWKQQLAWVLDGGLADDDRFHVRWISKHKGYGVFANVNIGKSMPVAVYTGVITNGSISDYMWTYPSVIIDPATNEPLNLGIDAKSRGNWARFINHEDVPNCDPVHIPYKNIWHVVYVSNRIIEAGEEVTVSYGEAYWLSRPGRKVLPGKTEPEPVEFSEPGTVYGVQAEGMEMAEDVPKVEEGSKAIGRK